MDYIKLPQDNIPLVLLGDVMQGLKKIPSESISCIVTSPPYWNLRDYYMPGQIGHEQTPEEYITKMVEISKELLRILKKDGAYFLNIGDTYIDKGLQMIPQRVAYRMINEVKMICKNKKKVGWLLRNQIIWYKCLTGDTSLFIKADGKYQLTTISELYNELNSFREVLLPTISKEGKEIWVKVKKLFSNGKAPVKKIVLTSGLIIKTTENHYLPVLKGTQAKSNRLYFKLQIEKVSNLKEGEHLWLNTHFNIDLPIGKQKDYKYGYLVGFFLAEGNFIYRKRFNKCSNFSMYALKRWALEKGYSSVEEYLKNRKEKEIVGIELSCGIKDEKKGYLDNFIHLFEFKQHKYGNELMLVSYGEVCNFIGKYIGGDTSHNKFLKNDVFNTSIKFLNGVLQGFLDGDGYYDKVNDRYRVNVTKNEELVESLMVIAKILNKEFRIHLNSNYAKSFGNSYPISSFTIQPYKNRIINKKILFQAIRKIENGEVENIFDLEVAPIYTTYCGKGTTDNPTKEKRKAKWNNLYFLANGILTHNSNHMPSPVKTRYTNTYEPIYFFTRDDWEKQVYFNLDAVRIPYKSKEEKYKTNQSSLCFKDSDLYKFVKNNNFGFPEELSEEDYIKLLPQIEKKNKELNYSGKFKGHEINVGASPGGRSSITGIKYVKKRKIELPQEVICDYLREWKEKKGISIKEIDEKLGYNYTAGHWFRKDAGGSLPSPQDWKKLKKLLEFDNKYDKEMTEMHYVLQTIRKHPNGKNPGDFWEMKCAKLERAHFAVFPEELPRKAILACCPPNGIVLDPFAGSGTTGKVAKELNRKSILIELQPKFLEIIKERCGNIKEIKL